MCGSSVAQTPRVRATAGTVAPVVTPSDGMKWQQARPGQESSALWGDRSTGPYGALNRFAAGFEDQRHFRTRDLRGLIISGTMIVQVLDSSSREVGPGSYIFLPGGTPHTHSCKAGASCVIFVEQEGAVDSVPAQDR
jgi:hypothetical protein